LRRAASPRERRIIGLGGCASDWPGLSSANELAKGTILVRSHHSSAIATSAFWTPRGFRATGITAYLKNGGSAEKAAAMASVDATTQLYDRRRDEVGLDEVERIADLSTNGVLS
jgi:hypothetical protein